MGEYVLIKSRNGGIIGGVTDAIGLTDYKGQKRAAAAASDANAAALEISREQIEFAKEQFEFQKEQYQDWKDIYGDVQENLGDYYKELDGDDLVAMGLQNQQREYQAAVKLMEKEATQRGLSGSGLEYAAKSTATFQNAEARANIRASSEAKANEQKLAFLGVGLGQGTAMLGAINGAVSNVNNASATAVNSRTSIANNFLNNSTSLSQSNSDTMGTLVGSFFG